MASDFKWDSSHSAACSMSVTQLLEWLAYFRTVDTTSSLLDSDWRTGCAVFNCATIVASCCCSGATFCCHAFVSASPLKMLMSVTSGDADCAEASSLKLLYVCMVTAD